MTESIIVALIAAGGALLGSIVGTISTLLAAKIAAKKDINDTALKTIFPIRIKAYQNVTDTFNKYIDFCRSGFLDNSDELLCALSTATLVAGDLAKQEIDYAYEMYFLGDDDDKHKPGIIESIKIMHTVCDAMNKDLTQIKLPKIKNG